MTGFPSGGRAHRGLFRDGDSGFERFRRFAVRRERRSGNAETIGVGKWKVMSTK